jgi:hypothetical protein
VRLSTALSRAGLALVLLGAASTADAGTAVTYGAEGGLHTTVFDGDPEDLDQDPLQIKIDFSLTHDFWSATGTIIALGGGEVPVETTVTDLLIENIGGTVINEALIIEHVFTSTLTAQPYFAELDGEYDKTIAALPISIADLLFLPFVNDQLIGGGIDPLAAQNVFPTVPFLGGAGPLYPAEPAASQTLMLRFYLDELGDAIRLHDSATITPVPEPGTWLLLGLGVAALGARGRR